MAAETNNAPLRRERTTAPHIPAPAGSMARTHETASRRDLLAFAGAATALGAAVGAGCAVLASENFVTPDAAPTPFAIAEAGYRAAMARFNGLPDDLEVTDRARHDAEFKLLLAAIRTCDATPAADLREFALSFLAATDDGQSTATGTALERLTADAKRLTGVA